MFKILKSSKDGELVLGTEKGLFFAVWGADKLRVDENQILKSKNVSQIC